VGGDIKITVKFLKEECTAADTGTNRGVIEILRISVSAIISTETRPHGHSRKSKPRLVIKMGRTLDGS